MLSHFTWWKVSRIFCGESGDCKSIQSSLNYKRGGVRKMFDFDVEAYLQLNYKPRKRKKRSDLTEMECAKECCRCYCAPYRVKNDRDEVRSGDLPLYLQKSVDDVLKELQDGHVQTFVNILCQYMNEKNLRSADVWQNSNISKSTFSKLLCQKDPKPQKETVLALCIGLQLNVVEARKFMSAAGYTFSSSNRRDLVVKCFIENSYYKIDELNDVLYGYGLGTLPKDRNMKEKPLEMREV